ncbi:hypothetical protein KGA66_20920 [Actinocrinis puniceicyclus]|uniref:Uncharacterized protein n=1 Tax=Actinocrinis puniceicyclus TaxID=977794 RepID=A0A8J7WRU7_9ACTN|nr:hypothetical protein [Actinocrinis puniceicyclus]MBS2965525.1 hypothetical protein [Actinocrinis puniceicyclus]
MQGNAMNAAEDRLCELMDAATCALDPPIGDILAAGERLGRARRRRRRTLTAAGTAAVVLLTGVGLAAGMRGSDLDDFDAAGQVSRPTRTALPSPDSGAPTAASLIAPPSPRPTGDLIPMSPAMAFQILRKLTPGWHYSTYGSSDSGTLLQVNADDGNGRSHIELLIAPVTDSGMIPVDCTVQRVTSGAGASRSGYVQPSCTVVTYPNGDKAMEQVLTSPPSRVVIYRVVVDRTDGIAVEITAQNGDPLSSTEATRPLPPLTLNRWAVIALDRQWQLQVPASLGK